MYTSYVYNSSYIRYLRLFINYSTMFIYKQNMLDRIYISYNYYYSYNANIDASMHHTLMSILIANTLDN